MALERWNGVEVCETERNLWVRRVASPTDFGGAMAKPFDGTAPGINWISSGDSFVLAINRGDFVEVYDMKIVRRGNVK